jgi:hypothetical protein
MRGQVSVKPTDSNLNSIGAGERDGGRHGDLNVKPREVEASELRGALDGGEGPSGRGRS